jgi:hypothetical protein
MLATIHFNVFCLPEIKIYKLEDHPLSAVPDLQLTSTSGGIHPQPEDQPCRADEGPTKHGYIMRTFITSNIIRVIKSRRVRWVEHVNRMGGMRNAYEILAAKPKGKRSLDRPRRRCHVILDCILEKKYDRMWTGFVWLRIGTSVSPL